MTYPIMGNTPKKEVPVSPLTPLGPCSVVYKDILPGGLQTDPANLLIIVDLRYFFFSPSGLGGGRNRLRLNA